MKATGINHVSIPCRDLDESEAFYREAFGLERIPSPVFRRPVRWLKLGRDQLHLMQMPDTEPLEGQHFGFDVDDFEAAFVKLRELGALDTASHVHPVWELPDGSVQMYAQDPAGNLIEINWPDVTTLDRDVVGEIPRRVDDVPQSAEALTAKLYHARAPVAGDA
jgi:catechol 2,3-dioxygenase-like lactoylglutathione lyase family enzyme